MRIDILTLFPEMCRAVYTESILGRAAEKGILTIESTNIRDYANNKHNRVDDAPYGGGAGMLMLAEPIFACFSALCDRLHTRPHLIFMSPKGNVLTQARAKELAQLENIAILCGHYEGVDQRVLDELVDEEISIGDYVLTGGELPALVLTDCIARMLDGTLSGEEAKSVESHYDGLLEFPQYTRPPVWHDRAVPDVLLSGHHANIDLWRRQQSLKETYEKRPDMFEKIELSPKDKKFMETLKKD
ncbi:MAG: tRNA (guanosine(37)-N1)-methyltransferase TrmD [Clostridia bacterium]|nr:tRNA (guanosine(37)-N1)-methyltransferase TrmD [Clostridia bacterium]